MFCEVLQRAGIPLVLRSMNRFGSYYRTVKLFSQVQETPGNKDKLAKIRQFNNTLPEVQKRQFFNLLQWYSRKESVRISSKIINKYYFDHHIAQYSMNEMTQFNIMQKLCKQNQQSQLTLFDVNLFLRYLTSVEGKGSRDHKIKKIIQFGENVSVLEGTFLLKLIEKKLTIGASKKTFRKINSKVQLEQEIDYIDEGDVIEELKDKDETILTKNHLRKAQVVQSVEAEDREKLKQFSSFLSTASNEELTNQLAKINDNPSQKGNIGIL